MNEKKENILGVILFVGLISHYLFGYFLWDKLGGEKLYSVTAYFNADVYGFIVYILAKSKWLKGMGALGMVLGSFFFYQEFNEPSSWVERDYLTFGLVFANCFFIWHFTEKFKNKNK